MGKRALTIAILVTLCGVAGAGAQVDVAGSWALEMTDPLGQAHRQALVLEQNDETLTGSVDGRRVEGKVAGDEITMSYEVPDTQVGPMTITFDGTVDGSRMEGTVSFGFVGGGAWTAAKED